MTGLIRKTSVVEHEWTCLRKERMDEVEEIHRCEFGRSFIDSLYIGIQYGVPCTGHLAYHLTRCHFHHRNEYGCLDEKPMFQDSCLHSTPGKYGKWKTDDWFEASGWISNLTTPTLFETRVGFAKLTYRTEYIGMGHPSAG